jgi:hypothetical protein
MLLRLPQKWPFAMLNKAIAGTAVFAIVRPLSPARGKKMSAQHESDYHPGSMDISQHKKFYLGFLALSKWAIIGIALVMIFLAIFRTHH